jgi:hypothetical protein
LNASTRSGRSLRRSLGLTAASAMVLAAMPAGMAAAQEDGNPPPPRDTSLICQAPYAADFDDVDSNNVHEENILCAADEGITVGFDDGTYRPARDIQRDQMASFIARWIEDATGETLEGGDDDAFGDVQAENVHRENINKLAEVDIVLGSDVEGNTYNPDRSVTRQQMTAFIRRALSYMDDGDAQNDSEPPASDSDYFEDVDEDNPFFDDIAALADQGIAVGYDEDTFGPGDPVRRDQMASFVMRGYDYAIEAGILPPPPADFDVSIDPTEGEAGTEVSATFTGDALEDVEAISVAGDCVVDEEIWTAEDSDDATATFAIADDAAEGACEITFTAEFEDETTATATATFTVTVAPTNQTFTVTPDDAAVLPAGEAGEGILDAGEREYTATDFGDVNEVVLDLADAEDVDVDNGTVTFESDNDDAELGDVDATIEDITVDGTSFPTLGEGDSVSVNEDSVVEFTVVGGGSDESVVPVVYEDDDNGLPVDDDGEPEVDFGIGGEIRFVSDVELEVDPADDTNPTETDHTVAVQLLDGAGDDLEAAGWDIDVIVAEQGVFGDYNAVTTGGVIVSGTITTDADGTAEFTYTGPDEERDDDIFFRWAGEGDFDEWEALADAQKSWVEPSGEAEAVNVTPEVAFNEVGGTHTVTATVVDNAGVGVADVDVVFNVDAEIRADFNATRTTNADGVATFTYGGPSADNDLDSITVDVLDEDGDSDFDSGDPVLKYWLEEGAANVDDVDVIGADIQNTLVFVDTGDDYLWFDYSEGDLWAVDGNARTFSGFESALEDCLDDDGVDVEDCGLDVEGYDDDEEDTYFNLVT